MSTVHSSMPGCKMCPVSVLHDICSQEYSDYDETVFSIYLYPDQNEFDSGDEPFEILLTDRSCAAVLPLFVQSNAIDNNTCAAVLMCTPWWCIELFLSLCCTGYVDFENDHLEKEGFLHLCGLRVCREGSCLQGSSDSGILVPYHHFDTPGHPSPPIFYAPAALYSAFMPFLFSV